jgi:uncharacterized protein with PQ loop repeat
MLSSGRFIVTANTEDYHMQLHTIGQLSLSFSFVIYCVYFLPQIWHNRKTENARSISYGLQLIYVLAYSADWLYGAAAQLEWQYRCVTLIGILALSYQQWQMRPAIDDRDHRYKWCTLAVITMITCSLLLSLFAKQLHFPINGLGLLSMLGAVFAFVPQLFANYRKKTGQAISHAFIAITLVCASLDMISAICLNWPWPSWVSPPALFTLHVFCWWQQRGYRKHVMAQG